MELLPKKVIETFLLVCEASYGPISDCWYQLFYFSLGTSLSGAISTIFAQILHLVQKCQWNGAASKKSYSNISSCLWSFIKILSKLFLLKKILMDLIWIMNTYFEVILFVLLLLEASHKQCFSTIVLLMNNLFISYYLPPPEIEWHHDQIIVQYRYRITQEEIHYTSGRHHKNIIWWWKLFSIFVCISSIYFLACLFVYSIICTFLYKYKIHSLTISFHMHTSIVCIK